MVVIIHFLEAQMTSILNILNKRKRDFKLHTWLPNVSKYSKTFNSDAEYWLVCWRSIDGPLTFNEIDSSDQRYANKIYSIYTFLFHEFYLLFFIIICRYSTRALLNNLESTCKFKVGSKVINKNQKPILLFMKHILCWSDEEDLIIDATSGTGTMAVSTLFCIVIMWFSIIHINLLCGIQVVRAWISYDSINLKCINLATQSTEWKENI
jgi:hypothetical protein